MNGLLIGTTTWRKSKMNTVFLVLLLGGFVACNKGSNTPPSYGSNEVKATVTLSSGSKVTINATGAKAVMGCGSFGSGTYVDGTSKTNAAVYISLYAAGGTCVTTPGTYSFMCEYRTDVSSSNTPIYGNYSTSNPGSITFTSISAGYMEGFFAAVCKQGTDSVQVAGTFKGDHLGH